MWFVTDKIMMAIEIYSSVDEKFYLYIVSEICNAKRQMINNMII